MNRVQKIDITSGTIFRIAFILLGFWFLYIVRDGLVVILAAIILSSAIEPVARRLQAYRVPRALSVVVVYLAALALIAMVMVLMVPILAEQIVQLGNMLPTKIENLIDRLGLATLLDLGPGAIMPQVGDYLTQLGDNLANLGLNIFRQTRNIFTGIFSLVFVFIITFYLVIEENAIKKMFRIIVPRAHIAYAERIIDRMQFKLGRWVLAQLTLGVIVGVVVGVGLWLLGVQYALMLGLLAGLLEIIPVLGPIIAGTVATLIALSQSLWLGVATLIFYVFVQQAENHLLIPNIMRKAVGLNPLVTLIAVLLGGRLAGLIGVILAVPVATMISIFLEDILAASDSKDELAG